MAVKAWRQGRLQLVKARNKLYLTSVEEEFDNVMAASDAAMTLASNALQRRKRSVGEEQLEGSLLLATRFLACHAAAFGTDKGMQIKRSGACSSADCGESGRFRLVPGDPLVYYVQGNIVKQVLTRLAMRVRLHGAEPLGGCGILADQAATQLRACLATAAASLPRFHVELLSLLRDAGDLRDLVASMFEKEEGRNERTCSPGDNHDRNLQLLAKTQDWATQALGAHREVLAAYGEPVLS